MRRSGRTSITSRLSPVVVACTAAVASHAGCVSSQYTPHDTPWLATTLHNGAPEYVIQGRTYSSLTDATAIDPPMHAKMKSAQSDILWGTVLASLASGVMAIGAMEITLAENDVSAFGAKDATLGFVLAGAGLATTIGGFALAVGGQRDEVDALNAFNDRMFAAWLAKRDALMKDIPPLSPTATPAPSPAPPEPTTPPSEDIIP